MEPSSVAPSPETLAREAGARPTPAVSRYERFRRQKFFTSLDGLRAISIFGVIWHHSAAPAFADGVPLVHQGNRGVNLFFVISAFLISTLLLRAKERNALDVPRFWIRRALRILPLYYAMLLGYCALVFFAEHDAVARTDFFAHLRYFATFTSNWFVELDSPRVIFFFAWSLAAEEQFYLCWPWIERALSRLWPAVVALALLFVSQGARLAYETGGREDFLLKIIGSVPAAILLGVGLAHVLHTPRGFRLFSAVLGRRGSAVGASALVLAALWFEPQFGFFGEVVVAVALAMLVGSCVIREDNDLAPVLRLRPVAWVGVISYGIYLMNLLCIGVIRGVLNHVVHGAPPLLLFVGGTLLTIAVASASYLTYERFFLRIKDRWFADRPAPARAPVNVEHPTSERPRADVPGQTVVAVAATPTNAGPVG